MVKLYRELVEEILNDDVDEEKLIYCDNCHKKAVWFYMPGTDQYCDSCVPRGCSCNTDYDGNEYRDLMGRPLPCCEYYYEE